MAKGSGKGGKKGVGGAGGRAARKTSVNDAVMGLALTGIALKRGPAVIAAAKSAARSAVRAGATKAAAVRATREAARAATNRTRLEPRTIDTTAEVTYGPRKKRRRRRG